MESKRRGQKSFEKLKKAILSHQLNLRGGVTGRYRITLRCGATVIWRKSKF